MITVLTLLKLKPSPNGEQHGERPFWREFGERYLDAWLANVERFVPQPHIVQVMTDTYFELPPSVGRVWLDDQIDAPGFWAKLNMFRREASVGKTLYCDLDNVINGPIDELCALEPDPLIMLDDRNVPGLPNGSLILFDADRCRLAWEDYSLAARSFESHFVPMGDDYSLAYDQAYIADWFRQKYDREPPLFQDLLPNGYILNAHSELPHAEDWRAARVIFGCGGGKEGKPHTSTHPGFALR